jgi:hypothetical protein
MSKRTWICVPCRKAYLRKKSLISVECPSCHGPCEYVHWASRVPSPNKTKAWDEFIAQHKAYKARMEADDRVVRESQEINKSSQRTKRSPAEIRVAYLEAICTPLIKTLNHSAALPANQLAGHAANLDFWVSEAKHCLAVIDGYQERFARLRAGQAEYERQHNVLGPGTPLRRGTKDRGRQELRRAVCEAIERFLSRCHREGLLSEEALKASLAALGCFDKTQKAIRWSFHTQKEREHAATEK